jgi:hypothetical protein
MLLVRPVAGWGITAAAILLWLCGCAPPGGMGRSASAIEQAQARVGYRIRVPHCLPDSVAPEPVRVLVEDDRGKGYLNVDVQYDFRDPKAQAAGHYQFAVSLMEGRTLNGEEFLMGIGEHKILDGIEVVLGSPQQTPGIEWIQDGIHFELNSDVSRDDTLRTYHSIVTDSTTCDLPKTA